MYEVSFLEDFSFIPQLIVYLTEFLAEFNIASKQMSVNETESKDFFLVTTRFLF